MLTRGWRLFRRSDHRPGKTGNYRVAASENGFEPESIAFVCNWCTYVGADLAGTSRIQYPLNVRVIRLMCSGSVDPVYALKPLLDGADGVHIGGRHPGDCHYQDGNQKLQRRVDRLKEILRCVCVDEARVWLRWKSASEVEILKRGQE
jgi:F420-non-reducing hydrogenase iron-sulfur subunit